MRRFLILFFCLPVSAWAQTAQHSSSSADRMEDALSCAYPGAALGAQSEGATLMSYRGTDDGRIVEVKIVQSSGFANLDDAAVQCANSWHFDPNNPVARWNIGSHRMNIVWSLHNAIPGLPPAIGIRTGISHTCLSYYPKAEREKGIEGKTLLSFTITAEGSVRDISVAQSSGNDALDAAAVKCAGTWLYRSALEKGQPVSVPWKATVTWKLATQEPPPLAEPSQNCLHAYPVRPADLEGIDGTTGFIFDIVEGGVKNIFVTHSSGNSALDRAAAACIGNRHYQREMVMVDGKNVDKYPSITIRETIHWADALKTQE